MSCIVASTYLNNNYTALFKQKYILVDPKWNTIFGGMLFCQCQIFIARNIQTPTQMKLTGCFLWDLKLCVLLHNIYVSVVTTAFLV